MTAIPRERMTVDEFLVWAEGRQGRWELEDGQAMAMSPERVLHARVKYYVQSALARAILRLLTDSALRRRLGGAGLKKVEAELSLDEVMRQTLEIYGSLLRVSGIGRAKVRQSP